MIEIVFPDFWPERLAWLAALATVFIGLCMFFFPRFLMHKFGLAPLTDSNNGVSEMRAALGGVWIGLGLSCLLLAQPFTYFALGLAFAFATLGRLYSFVVDRTLNFKCIVPTLFEGACAYFTLNFAAESLGLT